MEHEQADRRARERSWQRTDDADRINSLSDDILLSIFASLPVEEWLSLSAVSQEWHRLTRLLPRRDFFCCDLTASFPRAFIRRLHVVDSGCFGSERDIIQHAKNAAVEELVVENNYFFGHFIMFVRIPESVFHIKTLRLLSTKRNELHSYRPEKFRCTHLRTLKVEDSRIDGGVIKGVLDCCWQLETLHLVDFVGFTEANIFSDSLKNLWFRPRKQGRICGYSLRIRAPNLEVLLLDLRWAEFYKLRIRAPKVQEMCLYVSDLQSVSEMSGFMWFLITAKELTSFALNAAAAEVIQNVIEGIRHRAKVREKGTLKSVDYLDWAIRTPYEEKLLGVTFAEATELKRLELLLPSCRAEKVFGDIGKAPPRDGEAVYVDRSGRYTIKMMKF